MRTAVVILLLLVLTAAAAEQGAQTQTSKLQATSVAELSPDALQRSLALGTRYLLDRQRTRGDFDYDYHWIEDRYAERDSQRAQAMTLWGLALLHHDRPSDELSLAVQRGLEFFLKYTTGNRGIRYTGFPGDEVNHVSTLALVCLALTDYLRTIQPSEPVYAKYKTALDSLLRGLLRLQGGRLWFDIFHGKGNSPDGNHSPTSGGRALLALIKAAKYFGYPELLPLIDTAADGGYRIYIEQALNSDRKSKLTKRYYPWAVQAYFELADRDWRTDAALWGRRAMALTDWMIDERRLLKKSGNIAYALQGVALAYPLALRAGKTKRAAKYRRTVLAGLAKQTRWQIGSAVENEFIRARPAQQRQRAIGGIQLRADQPRILTNIVAQQLHALALTQRYVLTKQADN